MKTAKFLIAACLVACLSAAAYAQPKNSSYKKGYRADVELGTSIYSNAHPVKLGYTVSTSHGYCFGNGLYVGGGTGIFYDSSMAHSTNKKYVCSLPVFADVKYSFVDKGASPFFELKGGGYFDYTDCGTGYFVRPAIGLDAKQFSISVGIDYKWAFYRDVQYTEYVIKKVTGMSVGNTGIYVGISYNF